jgi:hypothetical protein
MIGVWTRGTELFLAEANIVSTPKFVLFIICFVILSGLLVSDEEYFIFVIDHANLLFHEAGHLIFGSLGPSVGLYGGTLGQLTIPVICGVAFFMQKSWVSLSVIMLWFFENLFNIAPYMADARSQMLPLVGGGEHDWADILSRWGVLQYDTTILAMLIAIGWLGLIATLARTAFLWWQCRMFYGGR